MDEDSIMNKGPVELVFRNQTTNHIAYFDKRLRFKKMWQAQIYMKRQPKPPLTIVWQIIFYKQETDIQKMSNCVSFDTLLEEVQGITEHGKQWELLLIKDGQVYRHYTDIHDCYGTKEIALSMFPENDVPIEGAKWIVKPYVETKDQNIPHYSVLWD